MSDSGMRDNPLVQPRMVRLLKERPRLINFGIREEVLDQLDGQICKRRSPQHLAERVSDVAIRDTSDAVKPVMRNRIEQKIENMNDEALNNL